MAGLFGASGVLEQLFLWSAASEVVSAMASPAMTALTQDENARHPLVSLAPDAAAQAVARAMLAHDTGKGEAALQGIDAGRFDTMVMLARARLDPATLAQLATRGMVTQDESDKLAALVGLDTPSMRLLRALEQPRIAPPDLATLVTRTIAPHGQAASEAALQGIDAEWFGRLLTLQQPRIAPADLATLVTRTIAPHGQAASEAALQGIDAAWFGRLLTLQQPRIAPADLATLVTRTIAPHGQAATEAALQGIDAAWFGRLLTLQQPRMPVDGLAQAVEHNLLPAELGADTAALLGFDSRWFDVYRELAKVRIQPADLATAVLRSYLTAEQAQDEATPQGVSPEMLRILSDLAGDAPGPDQLVAALLRKLIKKDGRGAKATTYEQGIAESRLHNKWAPMLAELGQALLSPPDAASAVIRNFITPDEGADQAAKSGVSQKLFDTLTHLAGDAPAPEELATALRRSLIHRDGKGPHSTSFEQGIAEGRLADKWAPVIEGLAKLWPTPVDALEAALKGQVTPEEGKDLYVLLGGDLKFYPWLLHSQGEGPTPDQAADWLRRGIIPLHGIGPDKTSYDQAVRESRYRDKWTDAYRLGSLYVPPPETVRGMLEVNAITREQAADLWAKSGMTADDIKAYIHAAEFQNTAQTRGLAINEVLTLYYGQVIAEDDTRKLLKLFHVPDHTADLLIKYTRVRRDISAVTAGVSRVKSLLAARKIGVQTAKEALRRLRVPAAAIDDLLAVMELEASISVRVLTESQIVDAWDAQIMRQPEAISELRAIGYTEYDAWVLLSIKNKAALPDKPARESVAPPGTVIPGVT